MFQVLIDLVQALDGMSSHVAMMIVVLGFLILRGG